MMVLVMTMCELTDNLVPRELSEQLSYRYSAYPSSSTSQNKSIDYSEIRKNFSEGVRTSDETTQSGEWGNLSFLNAEENSIYDHFRGRTSRI